MATSRKPASRSKKKTSKAQAKTETPATEDTTVGPVADASEPLVLTSEDATDTAGSEKTAPKDEHAASPPDAETPEEGFDPTIIDEAEAKSAIPNVTKDTQATDTAADDGAADPAPTPAPAAPARQPVFFPLLLGGLIAAGLGFLLAQYLGPLDGRDRAAALERNLDSKSAKIENLQETVSQQSATIEELQATQSEYAAQLSEFETALAEAPQGDPSLLSDELAATLDAQKSEITRLQGELEKMAEFAQTQIAAAEEEQADAAAAEARVKARGALNAVRDALASGDPFADALPDIAAAAEIPEALQNSAQNGVNSLAALQSGFSDPAREALSTARRETAGSSMQDRAKLWVEDLLGARSLTPRDGDDPDAVLSRAEAAARSGDLAGAIETLQLLPESGRDVMSGWISDAQTRIDAEAGFADLEAALSEN